MATSTARSLKLALGEILDRRAMRQSGNLA